MATPILILVLGFVLAPVALFLLVAVLVSLGRPADVVPTREWQRVRACRWLGLLVGGIAAGSISTGGIGTMLAPAVFGGCVVLGVAVGETLVRPAREAGPRTASLRTRRVLDYLPGPLTQVVTTALVVLVAALTLTTLTADDDAFGDSRALSCVHRAMVDTRSPYPGSYYSLPLAGVLLVVLLIAAYAAHQVVRRPRGLATTEHGDDVLRARSATVLLAAVGVATCFSLVGVGVTAGSALIGLADSCSSGWMRPTGIALCLVALTALFAGLWCLVRIASNDTRTVPVEAAP